MRNFILSFLFLCIPCLAKAQDVQADVTSNLADWESTNHDDDSTDSKTYQFSAEESDILSFDWYVSSEDYYDILTITLDGNTIVSSSGVKGATYITTLTAGSHTLVVSYSKDYMESANNDNAGIRNIKIMDKDALGEYIAFADANVWGICVENWDTNHDGVLSYSEAAAVTDIGQAFRESEITSFDELQYFTGLTSIGDEAFYNCNNLTSIVIPNSVIYIGDIAFGYCYSLTSIVIPNSVTSIGRGVIYRCDGLTNIIVEPDNPVYDSRDNCNAIIETSTNTLIVGCMNTLIPNSVTSIGFEAFSGCSGLTSIEIPNSVTSIGNRAFENCSGLTNIIVAPDNPIYDSRDNCNAIVETSTNTLIAGCMNTLIPNSVTSIGIWAFNSCRGLTSIEIPNSVISIGYEAFSFCTDLTSIVIPNSVTSIENRAFYWCYNMTNVYCYAETVPSTGSLAFYDTNYGKATLHVPACAIDDYKNTEPWSGFGSIVPLEFDLTVSDAGVATLYLDYSVAIPDVEGMGDVMYVSDVVGRTLVLTKVENNIPAHTGVIVYAQPGIYTLTSSKTHVDAYENSRLSGVTQDTPTADIDGTVYTLSVGKNQGEIGFHKYIGETLAANKAFLVMNESNEVNFCNFVFDNELTGISTTEQNVDAESAVIYDLQGRRVTSPSKGIYIVNGQKRIIINNR